MKIKNELFIEIRISAYYIYNYNLKMCPSLERSLSVFDYHSRKYTHRGFIYDNINKIMKISINVGLQFILDKCSSDGKIITNIIDKSVNFVESRRINKIVCKVDPRNDIQKESIDFIIAENASTKYKSHRLLTLATGFGKTVCSIIAAIKLQMPTVVISINLSQQWIDRLLVFTNGKLGEDIIHIKSWDDLDKLMNMKDPPLGSFFILGLDAANAAIRNDVNKLNLFYKRFGVGLQIFDEFHLSFIKVLNILVNTSVERTLYLSATAIRSDKSQDILFKKLFVKDLPIFGEKTHTINKYNIIYVNYKTNPNIMDIKKIESKRGIHVVNYFNYIFEDSSKYFILIDIIMSFCKKIFKNYPNKKIIIYIQSLKGIKIVKSILEKNLILDDGFKPSIGDYSGNVDKKIRHLELDNNIILSTLANTTGVDIKDLIMVINFIPFSSLVILRQIIGRLREENSWYVDITDFGFPGMIRQKNIRSINHKINLKSSSFFEYNPITRLLNKCFS